MGQHYPALTLASGCSRRANARSLRERAQILFHRPPEGDERVAPTEVEALEQVGQPGDELLGLERLVIEHARGAAVALGAERPVVVAGLDPEALGEPAAPGPVLARRVVARPGRDVLEL